MKTCELCGTQISGTLSICVACKDEISLLRKIKEDHEKKSDQLRVLKKKLKNQMSISKLEEKLAFEKRHKVDWQSYYGWDGVDDEAYAKDEARQEARVELLEKLIKESKR